MKAKNFAMEMTDMPYGNKNKETSLSNLISSSLVTRNAAFPLIAVSIMRLSSLSRQIVMSPEIKTGSACSSISTKSSFISFSEIPYLSFILGRLRTSASSSSMGSEMTAWNIPSSKDFLNLAGNPKGLSKEDTQTLVSITALTATLFFSDLFYGLGYIRFYFFWRILCGFFVYFLYNTVKLILPCIKRDYLYCNLFVFFYINVLKRFKNTVFKDSVYYFRHNFVTSYLNTDFSMALFLMDMALFVKKYQFKTGITLLSFDSRLVQSCRLRRDGSTDSP